MRKHFKQFLDELPDHLLCFFQDQHIQSFDILLQFTKEDLLRKRISQQDVDYLAGSLASYFYTLKSDDDHFSP